jgi:hypothetical protein
MLDHPLSPVHPRFEDTEQNFLVDSTENFGDRVQEILPVLTIVIREFAFDISKEEEVTRASSGL